MLEVKGFLASARRMKFEACLNSSFPDSLLGAKKGMVVDICTKVNSSLNSISLLCGALVGAQDPFVVGIGQIGSAQFDLVD